MESELENKVLLSNLSSAEYAEIESEFNFITDHIDILTKYIRTQIFPHINKGSFLDIGAGPGFITHKLLDQFNTTVALDPNNCYTPHYDIQNNLNNLKFINKKFESVEFQHNFDFILCSHVIYHVPQSQWPIFIQKIIALLTRNGNALLTLVATRGKFHDLCNQTNHNYSNSQVLKSVLKTMGIPYKTSKVISSYTHKEAWKLINLLKMFVIDDCFLPEEYAKLSNSKINEINQSIIEFVSSCYDSQKNLYLFQIEEDYIQLHID